MSPSGGGAAGMPSREELMSALRWEVRSPKPELLNAITEGQPAYTLPVNDAAALVALISAQPRPERADHLELYVVRDGKGHYATGTIFFEKWGLERAAEDWGRLYAQPGDMLYAALFGWTRHDVMTTEWVVRADLTAPAPAPAQEGQHE